jgi:hypothetical protein
MRLFHICIILLVGVVPNVANASEVTSKSEYMSYGECLTRISQASQDLGVAPINIVETNDLRVVRFVTSDGSVLVTCSREDGKMVITKSPYN